LSDERFKRKTLSGFISMYRNEATELRKFQRSSAVLTWLGAIVLVVACMAAWNTGAWPAFLISLAAAAGGIMLGVSLWFDTSHRQWPIIRPLIDQVALDLAAKENGID
jgi:hypothetical protein